jgi:hypothetical protein
MERNSSVTSELESRLEDLFGKDEGSTFIKDDVSFDNSALNDLKAIVLSIDWEINDEIMDRFIAQVDNLKESYKEDKVIILFFQLLRSVAKYIKNNKSDSHPNATRLLNSTYNGLENVLLSPNLSASQKEKFLLSEIKKFKMLKKEIAAKKAARAQGAKKKISAEPLIMEEDEEGDETQMDIAVKVAPESKAALFSEPEEEIEFDAEPEEELEIEFEPKTETEVEEKIIEKMAAVIKKPDKAVAEFRFESKPEETGKLSPHEAFAIALEEIKLVIKTEFQALRAELKLWREGS